MKKYIIPLSLFAFLSFAIVSCNKEEDQSDELQDSGNEDVSMAFNFDEELGNIEAMAMEGEVDMKMAGENFLLSSCATITRDTTSHPHKITIDFGTVNCLCKDGKYRRGILEIYYPHNARTSGISRKMVSVSYAVNDYEIKGFKTVIYKGLNAQNQPHSFLNSDLNISRPDGKVVSWKSKRTRTWISGYHNRIPFDNEYEISGTASGVSARGVAFNIDIINPLLIKANCSNIVSGILEISGRGFATRTLDYGQGNCDNLATITVNGNSRTITLR